ncbi:DNA polymerase III subunit delta' [Thermoflexus sp.]|uniref:DNA polymerase III subunit delta' n=1 Tax=Thermoflexus sp. TaxID=1969742 RepID=UPI00262DFEB2|nr:DNA polymerase III subunit delta' [Thermoflexus sp.]
MGLARWVVGHRSVIRLLERQRAEGRIAHAYLFTGPPHVGRRTLAWAWGMALLCAESDPPCGSCRACRRMEAGHHPDALYVAPEGNSLKIDQIREVQRQLALTPVEGPYRVVLFDEAEKMTTEAANALLKTLEEPPSYAVLMLIAPSPESLLPTVVSRCQILSLDPVPIPEVRQALQARWGVPAERADRLARRSGGRLGWAVQAAHDPEVEARYEERIRRIHELLSQGRWERFRFAEALAGEEEETRQAFLEAAMAWWRDVLYRAAGAPLPLIHEEDRQRIQRVAERVGLAGARTALEATRRTWNALQRNANARLALEAMLLDWPFLPEEDFESDPMLAPALSSDVPGGPP